MTAISREVAKVSVSARSKILQIIDWINFMSICGIITSTFFIFDFQFRILIFILKLFEKRKERKRSKERLYSNTNNF